ncbi:MAG: AAA family ATPase [Gammaproteobacteria bacterium]|nr:AAA family ATPase [Gammaproteobacteria bacterium]MCH9744101.1 AAA family ATPase [Gammaproteobacteria bacterium]
MTHIYQRLITPQLMDTLSRDKSVLLLGPRQTGKSTLIVTQVPTDIEYTFLQAELRQRFEQSPDSLQEEVLAYKKLHAKKHLPTVFIDEVQRVPAIMDSVQYCIDKKLAQFILTGSSARKLRHHKEAVNLLPGRVIGLHLDALSVLEIPEPLPDIDDLLLNGSLPEVIQQPNQQEKQTLLSSYVSIYLEQEVRAEALVRDLARFSRFLTLAAIEAGNTVNFSKLSQDLGVSRNTIYEYFQVLEDCLIVDRIEPITQHAGRRRLSKAVKYLFFDLGVRRLAAGEGLKLPQKYYGDLFEQFVGIEILKVIRAFASPAKLRYWQDHMGPEVDYVIEYNRQYLPIEVKWTDKPTMKDASHVVKFLDEYDCMDMALIVCRVPRPRQLADNVLALNWQSLASYIKQQVT